MTGAEIDEEKETETQRDKSVLSLAAEGEIRNEESGMSQPLCYICVCVCMSERVCVFVCVCVLKNILRHSPCCVTRG